MIEEDREKIEENLPEKEVKEKKKAEAIVNVYTSFNNTLVHVTDMSGRT